MSNKKLLSPMAIICTVIFSIPFFWRALHDFGNSQVVVGLIHVGFGIGFLFVAPIAWRLGDLFRQFAHPDIVFADGAMDLAGQKLFWIVGPQLIAVLIAFYLMSSLLPGLIIPKNSAPTVEKTNSPIIGENRNQPVVETKRQAVTISPMEASTEEMKPSGQVANTPVVGSMSTPVVSVAPSIEPAPATDIPIAASNGGQAINSTNVSGPNTWTPSFDCAKSSNEVEGLICSSKELSNADVDLSHAYKIASNSASDKQTIVASQRAWIKNERNVCKDIQCLLAAYKNRLAQLAH